MGHHPARIGRIGKYIKQLQERSDERVVEIHHHNHFIARPAGVFRAGGRVSYLTVAILGGRAGYSGEGREVSPSVFIGIAAGANRHLQIARLRLGGAIVNQQANSKAVSDIVNGGDTGLVLHGAFLRRAGHSIGQGRLAWACSMVNTIRRVIIAGYGVAHGLAGHILDQQPVREQQREIHDCEQQHQQDGQRKCKLDHALRTAGPLPEPFSIPGEAKSWRFHIHPPNAPTAS
jgi:hypothetical protein